MLEASTPPPPPFWLRAAASVIRQLPRGRFRAVSWLRRWLTRPLTVRMPKRLGGGRFVCAAKRGLDVGAWLAGIYEPQETALVRQLLRPGMTFVDVGANWGYFTLVAAASVGATGRVVALEPDPQVFSMLRANLDLNALPQAIALPVAAADRAGLMPLDGRGGIGPEVGVSRLDWGASPSQDAVDVNARPLDQIMDELQVQHVDLLKMDIEGAEVLALRGLGRCLAGGRVDRVILELHPVYLSEMGSSHAEVTDLLRAAGYHGWTIDHSPPATRRAYYARTLDLRRWIRPWDPGEPFDNHPHQLWVRPGLDPL